MFFNISKFLLIILVTGSILWSPIVANLKVDNDESHLLNRLKRGLFDIFFGSKSTTTTTTTTKTTTTTTTIETPKHEELRQQEHYRSDDYSENFNRIPDTDDEDLTASSAFESSSESSIPSKSDHVIEYYHCKFVIGEPYIEDYRNPNSQRFMEVSRALADGIQEIFNNVKGVQSITISKIEKYVYDSFACQVSADFGTRDFYDADILNRTLFDHIRLNRRIRSITVRPDGYQFSKLPLGSAELENKSCSFNQLRCTSGECLPIEFRCNANRECADGSDEFGCDVEKIDTTTKSSTEVQFTIVNIQNVSSTIVPVTLPSSTDKFEDRCRSDDKVRCGNQAVYVCTANFCDGIPDCPNHFDEDNCPPAIIECGDKEVQCDNTKCIPKLKICDGFSDCIDNTDESNCSSSTTERSQITTCAVNEFRCSHNECIPQYQVCDKVAQCSNGDDERGCKYECGSNEFRCNDGTCILKSAHCNRVYDCPDKSDEYLCEPNCTNSEFKCRNNVCIDKNYMCNGEKDCVDGSDEINCPNKQSEPCSQIEFRCNDGTCIKSNFTCDGLEDCLDGSDEKFCDDNIKDPCQQNEYLCEDGTCIPFAKKCNGVRDCIDGYDEYNCFKICEANEFRCDNLTCIPEFKKCDDVKDCNNGQDELNCKQKCSLLEHTCGDGKCVPRIYVCDSNPNCLDGSDEMNCGCAKDEFMCGTGECIKSFLQCNNRRDCVDGSDEISEYCQYKKDNSLKLDKCAQNKWKCLDGQCILREEVCDRKFDCRDHSDELNCLSMEVNELNLKTYPNDQTIKENVIKEGREVVFQCRDEGPLRALVRWTRPNGISLPVGSRDLHGRLEIPNIKLSDSGEYICEAVEYRSRPGARKTVNLRVEKLEVPSLIGPIFRACGYDQATCSNGQCISKSLVCDGKTDCDDGSDENRCSINGCEPNEFRCQNKKCILKIWRCDGDYDCDDKSDEQDCDQNSPVPGSPCGIYQFHCQRENKCIPRSYHCDTHRDCNDGSDEIGCTKPVIATGPIPTMNLTAGETLIITCKAVGIPVPEINWRLNWGHVPEKCSSVSVDGVGTLTCPDIQENDQGAYSCEAINIKGQTFAVPDTLVIVIPNRQRVCPKGYFNDDAKHPSECIKCFCFGNAVDCRSANLFTYQLNSPFETHKVISVTLKPFTYEIQIEHSPYYDNVLSRVDPAGSKGVQAILDVTMKIEKDQYPYFALPQSYLGPMLKSYGGYIKYIVNFKGPNVLTSIPDCIISGNGIVLSSKKLSLISGQNNSVAIRFFYGDWFRQTSNNLATREDIMMVLANVDNILIKLQYVEQTHLEVSILDIEIDSAAVSNLGLGKAAYVEQCECPVGYLGHSCEKCESSFSRVKVGPWLGTCSHEIPTCPSGFYGDPLKGKQCERCPCPLTSPSNQFARTCHLDYNGQVICDCPIGYVGRRCEQCDVNYSGNPLVAGDSCKATVCNPYGSLGQGYNEFGLCQCKDFVTGSICDQCKEKTFYLNPESKYGCVPCFCMGITNECTSSNWYRDTISAPFTSSSNDFELVNYETKNVSIESNYEINHQTRELFVNQMSYKPNGIYYWKLPSRFLGNKVSSYGGFLNYTIRYVPTPGGQSSKNAAPDVEIVSLNDITLMYYRKATIMPNTPQTISVRFFEHHWQRSDGKMADREHLLMALADVQSILIKATYTTSTTVTFLSNVEMDIASETNTGLNIRADAVEKCRCPRGYTGLSCEDCDFGYTRTINGLYLGTCEACSCNGHSTNCDSETGACLNCDGNTIGQYCEQCANGYERDAGISAEQPCHPIGHNFTICSCNLAGSLTQVCLKNVCMCKSNVEGANCNQCRSGTFGLDENNAHGCISCFCSGVSNRCTSSNLYMNQIPVFITEEDTQLVLTDIYRTVHINNGFVTDVSKNELGYNLITNQMKYNRNLYWSLPSHYLGNRLMSYGGNLEFKQRFVTNFNGRYVSDRDILISGNGLTVVWSNPSPLIPNIENKIMVTLSSNSNWYRFEDKRALRVASREDLMIVLANVDSILVRAVPFENTLETYISDIALDTASTTFSLSNRKSKLVESCQCPDGHDGLSCEKCKQGYYHDKRDTNVASFGVCKKCPCNGNENSCYSDQYHNVICECKKGFGGSLCELQGIISMELIPSEICVELGLAVNFTCSYEGMQNLTISLEVNDNRAASIFSNNNNYFVNELNSNNRAFSSYKKTASWTVVLNAPKSLDVICLLHTPGINGIEKGKLISKLIPADVEKIQENENLNPLQPTNDRPSILVTVSSPSIQVVEIGREASFNCSARSVYSRPLRVYWRKEAGQLPPGRYYDDDRGLLVITNVQLSDSGVYVCHADDGHVVITDKTTLHVGVLSLDALKAPGNIATPPKVIIYPPELTVYEGNPIEVLCKAIGNPEPNLRWTKTDGFMNPEHDFNNGQFRVPYARKSDEGEYRCIATNTFGSNVAVTRIRVLPNIIALNLPVIIPDNYEGFEGQDIVLNCRSTNSKPNGINWYRINGARLPYGTIQQNGILTIKSARVEDSGIYVCNATSISDEVTRKEISVTIMPQGTAPTARVDQVQQVIGQGMVVDIVCRVTGNPSPSVKWIRNGAEFDSNVKQIDNMLHFDNARIENRGHYICLAANARGEAQTSVLVEIERRELPLAKIYPEGVQKVNIGSSAFMQCRASGIPNPTVSWSRGGNVPLSKNIDQLSDPRILRLNNVDSLDAGEYICTVDNVVGRNSASTRLFVQIPPSIRIVPDSKQINVRKGDRFMLNCAASGDPIPTVKWNIIDSENIKKLQYESTKLGESTYIINNANDEHSGAYVCEAQSDAGIDRKYINVIVNDNNSSRGDIPINQFDESQENNIDLSGNDLGSREFLAPVGKNAVLRCRVEDNLGDIIINWKRADNVPLPESSYSRDGILYIPNIQPSASGEYICLGTFSNGRQQEFSRTFLRITFPPNIVLNPAKQYVQPDDNVHINCEASGDQPIELNWSLLNGSLGSHIITNSEGLLLFNRIKVSDAGRYVCTAKNQVGIATATAEVVVEKHNVYIRPENGTVQVITGETAYLRCLTDETYSRTVMWTREDQQPLPRWFEADGMILKIPDAQPNYNGVYKCQINTYEGPKSAYVRLNVTHCKDFYDLYAKSEEINEVLKHRLAKCDFCVPNPCQNSGLCQKSSVTRSRFVCQCKSGFYGDRCEYRLRQFCGPKTCGSGKCVERENSYECYCPFKKTGLNCERDIDILEPAFSENSYITYPPPSRSQKNHINFGLKLKPMSLNDGVILYCGQNEQGHGDFASIAIKDKHIEFRFDVGSGPIVLKSNRQLMPHEWITVTAGRSLDGNVLVINNNDSVTSKNVYKNELNLNTPLYVGGYNNESIVLNKGVGVYGGFNGCITKVNVSGNVLDLISAFRDAANVQDCSAISKKYSLCDSRPCLNNGICTENGDGQSYICHCLKNYSGNNCEIIRDLCMKLNPCQNGGSCHGNDKHYVCDCLLGFTGVNCEQSAIIKSDVHFNGRGYLELSKHYLNHDNNEHEMIALELSTNSTNGLILWHGQEPEVSGIGQDFLSLSVQNGYLEYSFNLGSGETILHNSQIFISNGQKHRVILKRQKFDASIEIDDEYVEFGSAKGFDDSLDCLGNIYLGGLPNVSFMTGGKFSNGFTGCIHAFEIQDSNTIDLGNEALSGINVVSCSKRNWLFNTFMISDFDEIFEPPPVNIIHPKPLNSALYFINTNKYVFVVILVIISNIV